MLENKLSNLPNDELKELIRILEIKNKEKQKKIEKDQKL